MATVPFHRTALIIIFFVCTVPFVGCAIRPQAVKHVNVVFRFDDYSSVSAIELERQLIDLFGRHQAPITFAVIPFACAGDIHDPSPQANIPLGPQKINLIKTAYKKGILDIGLHGYSHQTIRTGHYAEFEGLDYNSQLDRLTKGKQYLEEIVDAPVLTFMPPWNRYDRNTLRALGSLGFTMISADLKGITTEDSQLHFFPANCRIGQLRKAVAKARAGSGPQPAIVVLFHEYDFKEIDKRRGRITFQEFSALVDWLGNQPDVSILSLRQATRACSFSPSLAHCGR
jgi:peptidoglycan/xylan/chitin deacetylase (PgdA/CDA1 family)